MTNDAIRPSVGGFINLTLILAIHGLCLTAFWTGIEPIDVAVCVGLYCVRVFGVTAGYHRYFSHRTYKMGRVTQFLMALLAMTSAQKGVIWWAHHHRHHHRHSDKNTDAHSPRHHGFWWSHLGWWVSGGWDNIDLSRVKDLARYPELRALEKVFILPAVLLGFGCWLAGGWSMLVVGFFWSTVAVWHATFTINSLAHVFGKQRYETGDDSRNNFLLALLTFGEGWHNNHHYYQASANQGWRWYEVDITFYILKMLSWTGLVWDLRTPPKHVVEGQRHPRYERARRRAPIRATAQEHKDSRGLPLR